jgi:hypothetical protein
MFDLWPLCGLARISRGESLYRDDPEIENVEGSAVRTARRQRRTVLEPCVTVRGIEGPFPPETGPPVPGGRYTQEQPKNSNDSPRNPRASSGRRPTATRDAPTRERRRPERGRRRGSLASATPPTAKRSGGGRRRGKQHRPRPLPDADHASREAKRGSWLMTWSTSRSVMGRRGLGMVCFVAAVCPGSLCVPKKLS